MKKEELKAVDFFCSGGGMSYGMQKAGIKILGGIDFDKTCEETYITNINETKFICADIFKLTETALEEELSLQKKDDNLILIGCSPCQFWSIINTDKTKSKESKNLLIEFGRFVKHFVPGYVVVENVPGVLRRKEESGLEDLVKWLESNEYKVHHRVHNVNNYGVPQNRKRFTLIANRITNKELEPVIHHGKKPTTRDVIGEHNDFIPIEAGHRDKTTFLHTVPSLSEINKRRLKKVKKDGGDRFGFAGDPELQLKCFIGKEKSFKDTFGRLWWDKPSSTITTKFFSISNGRFAHPEEDRALSIREGAVLQSFPRDYIFKGSSIANIAKMIGNAVPPVYAEAIAKAIIQNHQNGTI
jgi:DNA (cytosine-5)-methyltransferase 1